MNVNILRQIDRIGSKYCTSDALFQLKLVNRAETSRAGSLMTPVVGLQPSNYLIPSLIRSIENRAIERVNNKNELSWAGFRLRRKDGFKINKLGHSFVFTDPRNNRERAAQFNNNKKGLRFA